MICAKSVSKSVGWDSRWAIVMSEVFLRRLTPSPTPFVRRQQDFRTFSIHRPLDELARVLRELGGRGGLITEWLPGGDGMGP